MNIEQSMNSVFEETWWIETVTGAPPRQIVIEEDEKAIACWNIYAKGKKILMPPLTQTCGPCIYIDDNMSINEQSEHIKRAIYALLEKAAFYSEITIALDPKLDYFLPFFWKGFRIIPSISYRITELNDLEKVFANFTKNIRRDIKRAEKLLHIVDDLDINEFHHLMEQTFAEQKRKYPYSRQLLENIIRNATKHGAGKVMYAVDDENNIHAAAFFLHDARTCYYLIAGKNSAYKNSNAPTFLIWEGIKYAATVSRQFDFEGSMIEGIENFFRRFGGTPIVYYRVEKGSVVNAAKAALKPYIKRLLHYKV